VTFGVFVCSAQTAYKNVTPGKTSRLSAERILGKPVKVHSPTLADYAPQLLTGKIRVQYGKDGIVERIEFHCASAKTSCERLLTSLNIRLPSKPAETAVGAGEPRNIRYLYAAPHYLVKTWNDESSVEGNSTPADRLALFSGELYDAVSARIKQAKADAKNAAASETSAAAVEPQGPISEKGDAPDASGMRDFQPPAGATTLRPVENTSGVAGRWTGKWKISGTGEAGTITVTLADAGYELVGDANGNRITEGHFDGIWVSFKYSEVRNGCRYDYSASWKTEPDRRSAIGDFSVRDCSGKIFSGMYSDLTR
jgi:hypothetical protein